MSQIATLLPKPEKVERKTEYLSQDVLFAGEANIIEINGVTRDAHVSEVLRNDGSKKGVLLYLHGADVDDFRA